MSLGSFGNVKSDVDVANVGIVIDVTAVEPTQIKSMMMINEKNFRILVTDINEEKKNLNF